MKIFCEQCSLLTKSILELMDDGICVAGIDSEIVTANKKFMSIKGISESSDKTPIPVLEYIQNTTKTNEKSEAGHKKVFAWLENDEFFSANLEVHKCPQNEQYSIILIRDLTLREQVFSLTGDIAQIEEEERVKISRYLHDEIAQLLVVAGNKMAEIDKQALPDRTAGKISSAVDYIETAILKIRRLTWELGSSVAMKDGLSEALQDLLFEIVEREGIETDFIDDGEPKPLDDSIKTALFQMTRELFYNVIKHARASQIYVVVERDAEFVRIIVEDNGKGFAYKKKMPSSRGGFGLATIERRLNNIGGKMIINSWHGKGTRVEIFAPLQTEEQNDDQSAYRRRP